MRSFDAFLRTSISLRIRMAETTTNKGPLRIALAYQLGAPYPEQITHGILRYSQEQGPWEIVSSPEGSALPFESLSSWKGDGVIAMLETNHQVAIAHSLKLPIVNLATSLLTPRISTVSGDQQEIGKLAAEHFLKRNFRRFAYYGLRDVWYSSERLHGYRECLRNAGYDCDVYETESSLLAEEPWKLDREGLSNWLSSLSPPTAVFTAHDYRARILLERCADLGIEVPSDLAVIGVDDDPIVCQFSEPPLSSIRQNGAEVGYLAASVLDSLIRGEKPLSKPLLVSPEELIARDSTRVVAVEDTTLRKCLDLIDLHHSSPIDVAWLVSRLNASRRHIEKLFQTELGESPHEYLSNIRIERAKTLLDKKPPLPLREIAGQCGFSEPRRLNIVFQRIAACSPREYRDRQTD